MLARRHLLIGISLTLLAGGQASAAGRPDLVEVSISKPPGSVGAGLSFALKDKVQNKGGAKARASATGFYLSLDRERSQNDLRLGRRRVPELRPGRASAGSRHVTVPANAPLGRYLVLACADDEKVVREGNERNNCRVAET